MGVTVFNNMLGVTMLEVTEDRINHILTFRSAKRSFVFKRAPFQSTRLTLGPIRGYLRDLVGSPILVAYEDCFQDEQSIHAQNIYHYRFGTAKGAVKVDWTYTGCSWATGEADMTVEEHSP
jgi:hypothetical protein